MNRQWPSGLQGARAELRNVPRGRRKAPGLRRTWERSGATGISFGMLHAKIAFVAGVMAASLLGGIALGGYTADGFNEREPADLIAQAASGGRNEGFRAETAQPQGPANHVCKGCDAKLYREDAWYSTEADYDTDEEWAREEQEGRDVARAALADRPHDRDRDGAVASADDFPVNQDVAGQTGTVIASLDD